MLVEMVVGCKKVVVFKKDGYIIGLVLRKDM